MKNNNLIKFINKYIITIFIVIILNKCNCDILKFNNLNINKLNNKNLDEYFFDGYLEKYNLNDLKKLYKKLHKIFYINEKKVEKLFYNNLDSFKNLKKSSEFNEIINESNLIIEKNEKLSSIIDELYIKIKKLDPSFNDCPFNPYMNFFKITIYSLASLTLINTLYGIFIKDRVF